MNEIVLERMLSWQVVQANYIQSMLIGGKEKPRPTMRPVAYRVPMDGKAVTVACCNLGVMFAIIDICLFPPTIGCRVVRLEI